MNCYYCGGSLDFTDVCPDCDADVRIWKKINMASDKLYNDGLEKARVRDLSGAIEVLQMSLRYNKLNAKARNLLGLCYYETGEVVNALSEWVICKSMAPEDALSAAYLAEVQSGNAQLEDQNQTSKKYNQALAYCRQKDFDLAIIQLKKVIGMNPKMVKAYQLLGLLHMQEGRYDLAYKVLRSADKIDAKNQLTMSYLRECRTALKGSGKLKSREDEEAVTYQSENEVIIRPRKLRDNTAVRTVVSLLMGAAIGVAVVYFLVLPGITQSTNAAASAQLVEANQSLQTKEEEIESLTAQLEALESQLSDAEAASATADDAAEAAALLLSAYVSYADEDYTATAETLSAIDATLLGEEEQALYTSLAEKVEDATLGVTASNGISQFKNGKYSAAIETLLPIATDNAAYKNGEVSYYLAYSYYYLEDYPTALQWFVTTAENTTNSERKSNAESMVATIRGWGYTAANE